MRNLRLVSPERLSAAPPPLCSRRRRGERSPSLAPGSAARDRASSAEARRLRRAAWQVAPGLSGLVRPPVGVRASILFVAPSLRGRSPSSAGISPRAPDAGERCVRRSRAPEARMLRSRMELFPRAPQSGPRTPTCSDDPADAAARRADAAVSAAGDPSVVVGADRLGRGVRCLAGASGGGRSLLTPRQLGARGTASAIPLIARSVPGRRVASAWMGQRLTPRCVVRRGPCVA